MGISSHRVLYLQLFDSYNICMIYLHIIEACLKVTIAMIYFFHSKNPSNIMKNIFNCISLHILEKKSLLTNIKNKYVIKNKSSFFVLVRRFINMITDSSLVQKWPTLDRARRHVSKNLLNLDCQDSIRFGIFQVAYK